MTIKPNTWISVKDAMPEIVPISCDLITMDIHGNIDDCLLTMEKKEVFSMSKMKLKKDITHWMLLSKPETK
jgi:hypothetical protein